MLFSVYWLDYTALTQQTWIPIIESYIKHFITERWQFSTSRQRRKAKKPLLVALSQLRWPKIWRFVEYHGSPETLSRRYILVSAILVPTGTYLLYLSPGNAAEC